MAANQHQHVLWLIVTHWASSKSLPAGIIQMERVIRTIKENLVWTRDYQSAEQFKQDFSQWVKDYNEDFPHMALRGQTPEQFKNNILLKAA